MGSIRRDSGCTVYVGDLPAGASEKELERIFREYGRLKNVWVARNPPGFAFVEFDIAADANDAVRELDGTVVCGVRARVEMSSGKSRQKPWVRNGHRNGGPMRRQFNNRPRRMYDPSDRCYQCGERGHYAYDCNKPPMGNGPYGRDRFNSQRRSRSPMGYSNYYDDRFR